METQHTEDEDALSERVHVLASRRWLAGIDEWRRGQGDLPSRGLAIRKLVERGLRA